MARKGSEERNLASPESQPLKSQFSSACAGDSTSDSELARLLLGRCWQPGTALGAAAAVPHAGLWNLPEATKDCRREGSWHLAQHRGLVGDAFVSPMGQGSRACGIKRRQGSNSTAPAGVLSYCSNCTSITVYQSFLDAFDARELQELEPLWSPALLAYLGAEGKDEESGWGLSQNGILPLLISSQLLQWGNNLVPANHSPFQGTRGPCWQLQLLQGAAALGNRSCC